MDGYGTPTTQAPLSQNVNTHQTIFPKSFRPIFIHVLACQFNTHILLELSQAHPRIKYKRNQIVYDNLEQNFSNIPKYFSH